MYIWYFRVSLFPYVSPFTKVQEIEKRRRKQTDCALKTVKEKKICTKTPKCTTTNAGLDLCAKKGIHAAGS